MLDLDAIGSSLHLLSSSWQAWAVIIPGLLIGLISGAIPGFSVALAMAIFLPMSSISTSCGRCCS